MLAWHMYDDMEHVISRGHLFCTLTPKTRGWGPYF
jgi:hypothetical protein